MKNGAVALLLTFELFCLNTVYADTFGAVANQFNIEFVPIGNPNNPADLSGVPWPAGKIEYVYRIGKYEISEDMVNKANAAAGLGITHLDYGANKPAIVSWFDAARFVNWLNTSSGHPPAYKFDGTTFELWGAGDLGYSPDNPFRNTNAYYFLPNAHEWYKAAYYDPVNELYYDYPTGSDNIPDGLDFVGDRQFDAVIFDIAGFNPQPPNDVTDVGLLSPYGTAGQGGNVWEWEETEIDLVNDSIASARGVRGSDWKSFYPPMLASSRGTGVLPQVRNFAGFRVASVVPEPCTALFGALATAGLLSCRTRLLTLKR